MSTTNGLLIPKYNTLLAEFNVTGLALSTTTLHSSLVPTISVFRLKLNEINIIHSGPLKLSPWVVLTKHICKKTSRHSRICAPMKPSYINTTTSSSVNLGCEEQLTIVCSSLNECILFAVRVFYLVFLHVQKWKTMLHLHVTNSTNKNIAWTWDRYPSTVRFHQTRVTWSLNTADSQCSETIHWSASTTRHNGQEYSRTN